MNGPRIKRGKHGADVRYWHPAIWGAMWIAERLWGEMFPTFPFVITSGCEGKHSPASRHYDGRAGDVRTKDPQGVWALTDTQRAACVHELRNRLGDEYDVTATEPHYNLHIELDPKEPVR